TAIVVNALPRLPAVSVAVAVIVSVSPTAAVGGTWIVGDAGEPRKVPAGVPLTSTSRRSIGATPVAVTSAVTGRSVDTCGGALTVTAGAFETRVTITSACEVRPRPSIATAS